jgi:hypothetical protein
MGLLWPDLPLGEISSPWTLISAWCRSDLDLVLLAIAGRTRPIPNEWQSVCSQAFRQFLLAVVSSDFFLEIWWLLANLHPLCRVVTHPWCVAVVALGRNRLSHFSPWLDLPVIAAGRLS